MKYPLRSEGMTIPSISARIIGVSFLLFLNFGCNKESTPIWVGEWRFDNDNIELFADETFRYKDYDSDTKETEILTGGWVEIDANSIRIEFNELGTAKTIRLSSSKNKIYIDEGDYANYATRYIK